MVMNQDSKICSQGWALKVGCGTLSQSLSWVVCRATKMLISDPEDTGFFFLKKKGRANRQREESIL
jgi:hypothetical protein